MHQKVASKLQPHARMKLITVANDMA